MSKIRPIAIYLPQYHPIPENDEWWGKGFTEWTNVTKAKPSFKGHYQPHLPADLGFYDLRLEEARLAQETLAKQYGIHGFCYYHYWFNGKRLLYEPLDRKLKNPKEDLPFMLCWANENWTRAWDGGENKILIKQEYSEDDDREHIRLLLKYFKDERYIKVNEKPIFCFYKPDIFPNIKRTLEIFRNEASKEGMELYLCWFERSIGLQGGNHEEIGFDAAVEFQPVSKSLRSYNTLYQKMLTTRIKSRIHNWVEKITGKPVVRNQIIDYKKFVDFDIKSLPPSYKRFPCVCPMWDNAARRVNQAAVIFHGSTPQVFSKWYKQKVENFISYSKDENFIFINAWNEWAEGNHLEPCQKWGRKYLEAMQ